jgi:hypothetical protein
MVFIYTVMIDGLGLVGSLMLKFLHVTVFVSEMIDKMS